MFTIENQKTRLAYAEFYGVDFAEVYFCDTCGTWDHTDESGWGSCGCF